MPVAILINRKDGPIESNIVMKEHGKVCPHLKGDTIGQFTCEIHDCEAFQDTPCASHSQFEHHESNCRTGEHILKLPPEKQKTIVYGVLL